VRFETIPFSHDGSIIATLLGLSNTEIAIDAVTNTATRKTTFVTAAFLTLGSNKSFFGWRNGVDIHF
jgi:hypothetical protein